MKYAVIKVGGFGLGNASSIAAGKAMVKACGEYGLYQIVSLQDGICRKEIRIK